ncbi:MAG: hypothetical protein GF334_10045 [Candidatus Altiarchaeales archaeon]|nr:hypothetical protein [Candidatus Altiarchaeales archaeon]
MKFEKLKEINPARLHEELAHVPDFLGITITDEVDVLVGSAPDGEYQEREITQAEIDEIKNILGAHDPTQKSQFELIEEEQQTDVTSFRDKIDNQLADINSELDYLSLTIPTIDTMTQAELVSHIKRNSQEMQRVLQILQIMLKAWRFVLRRLL